MSLRLEMLQVARLAPKVLGDSTDLVRAFLLDQQNEDGGFRDRTGGSDLYYTVFGLEGLLALESGKEFVWQDRVVKVTRFLEAHGDGDGLDFVHLCCLARCWASVGMLGQASPPANWSEHLASRLSTHRSADGGFHAEKGAEQGTAYGAFLGLGGFQDLSMELADPNRLVESLHLQRLSEGAWSNESKISVGSTNATAAALTLLNNQQHCLPPEAADWLIRQEHAQGGFKAAPRAPIPDLLSTATALHALSAYEWDIDGRREKHMDFIDSLWTNQGAFHGNWADEDIDSEYTYYGLLALGHLSV